LDLSGTSLNPRGVLALVSKGDDLSTLLIFGLHEPHEARKDAKRHTPNIAVHGRKEQGIPANQVDHFR
jgi:hypothetical protein